jgi:hypothetical protein
MYAVVWLPQATMATTAVVWFTLYEPSFMNPQLSVYVSKPLQILGAHLTTQNHRPVHSIDTSLRPLPPPRHHLVRLASTDRTPSSAR